MKLSFFIVLKGGIMKVSQSMLVGLSLAALIGCGHDNKKTSTPASPTEAQNKQMVELMQKNAPKFIIAIADKDGKLITTQTADKMPEGASNEEIAKNILKNKDKGSDINVLNSDAADSQDQSTESCHFWHGGGAWGWNSYPVYGYGMAGYPTYYGAYGYAMGAAVANYSVAVYSWANAYSYAPMGCGYGYAAAYANCATPFSYPSYY